TRLRVLVPTVGGVSAGHREAGGVPERHRQFGGAERIGRARVDRGGGAGRAGVLRGRTGHLAPRESIRPADPAVGQWGAARSDGCVMGASGNGVGTGRLPVGTVQRIERLVGGDPVTEDRVLRFIGARYGAKNLFYLPPHVAVQVYKRPADFIRA